MSSSNLRVRVTRGGSRSWETPRSIDFDFSIEIPAGDRHRRERNLSRCNLLGFKSRFNCNFLFSHCLLSSSKLVARTQTPTELTRRRTTRKNNNRFAEPKRTSFTLSSFSFQRILFHYSTTLTSSFPRVLIVAKPSFAPLHLPILDIPSLHVETFPPIQS